MIARINNYIQRRLQEENLESVPLKSAATWLAREGILRDTKSSPGFPLRRHIHRGNILGAAKHKGWRIYRLPYYEEILDPDDLRDIFGLRSRTSIYRKIKEEQIPYIRNSRKGIYFRIMDLLKWAIEKRDNENYGKIQKKYQEIKRNLNLLEREGSRTNKS